MGWGIRDRWLIGTDGADSLRGGPGRDWLIGGAGEDTLLGGEGDDLILAGPGDDIVFGEAETPPPAGGTPGRNAILGGDGDDRVTAGLGADTVLGGAGDDTLLGHGGNPAGSRSEVERWLIALRDDGGDLVAGGEGRDSLDGGGGPDLLLGGEGADSLRGGLGLDVLEGGPGRDAFLFARGSTFFGFPPDSGLGTGRRDMILDFRPGEDVIDLGGYLNPTGPRGEALLLGAAPFQAAHVLQVRWVELELGTMLVQVFGPTGSYPEGVPVAVPQATMEILVFGAPGLSVADFAFEGPAAPPREPFT